MTAYTVLNEVSVRHHALMMSKFAMDIEYKCPECGEDRMVTWLFPDTKMEFFDDCCHSHVRFTPETGSEEE